MRRYHHPDEIRRELDPDMIFVFGSNLAGVHGAGAARQAYISFGAWEGEGIGPVGSTYAIPTKDEQIRTLPISRIRPHVKVFLDYARVHPKLTFYVTRVGCGLAGYTDEQIAPLFEGAPDNCILPEGW